MTESRTTKVLIGPDVADAGPLGRRVLEYTEVMRQIVPSVSSPADWAPLAGFVAVDEFERVGTFLERQNWQQYTEMLTQWASATDTFETSVHRIAELEDFVYFEIEERHYRSGTPHVVNSMTVFAFDAADKIRHLDVYLQQRR